MNLQVNKGKKLQRSLASESKSIGYSIRLGVIGCLKISSLLPVGISFVPSSPFSLYHDSMGYQDKLREVNREIH